MSDLLGIAKTGVRAYAKALEVVADNVANAATPGHVRRTTTLSPATMGSGNGPLELDPIGGNGVRLTAIGRAIDYLRADTVRRGDGDVAALDAGQRWLSTIQSSLTGPAALDRPLAEVFSSLADLANDPTSPAVRATVLARADTLADRFNASAASLDRIGADIAREADTEAQALNGLTQGLAALNAQLRRASSGSGAAVVLADERDRLLAKMATYVSFDVRLDARGQADVRVPDAGGPLLVQGDKAQSVRMLANGDGSFQLRIGPKGEDRPASLTGGTLAGLSNAGRLLENTRSSLDGLADRLAADFNRVHQQGVTLDGADGGPIFATRIAEVKAAGGNGGNARLSATLDDGAEPGTMRLVFDGGSGEWTLARDDDSAAVAGQLPLSLDGLTVDGIDTPRNGDLFRITTRTGAAGIALRPLAGSEIAAAPRWQSDAAPANQGGARVDVENADPAALPATGPFAITARDDGSLELRDSLGDLLATGQPGDWLAGDGFRTRVLGPAQPGDRFAIARNTQGGGGNANAIALFGLADAGGAAGTLGETHDRLVTGIAVPLAETRVRLDVARANRDSAAEALNEASGVDLNTEATEMLRLQQAFQANARIIQVARETFDAILSAAR